LPNRNAHATSALFQLFQNDLSDSSFLENFKVPYMTVFQFSHQFGSEQCETRRFLLNLFLKKWLKFCIRAGMHSVLQIISLLSEKLGKED